MLQDVQNKMRDAYKKTGDEFLTSQIALHGKVGKNSKEIKLKNDIPHKYHGFGIQSWVTLLKKPTYAGLVCFEAWQLV